MSKTPVSKRTMGSVISDLSQKAPDSLDPIEIQRATEKEYLNELIWCIKHAQKKASCRDTCDKDCVNRTAFDGDFFVECLLKKEKVLANTLRNYFVPRRTCPAPHFDQTVYKYNSGLDDVEFLWVVPDQETCEIFRENKNIIVPAERDLLKNVLAYYDGTLFMMMKKFNGEKMQAGVELKEK